MIIGFCVVLVLAIAMVIDATAAYVQRQQLSTLADGAALSAADGGVQENAIYAGEIGKGDLVLSQDLANRAVHGYLAKSGAYRRFPGLKVQVHISGDRRKVTVNVSAPLDLPLTVPGAPTTAVIGASGGAAVSPDDAR
jgi:Putative Flp pilus-assembly TadE/G-like